MTQDFSPGNLLAALGRIGITGDSMRNNHPGAGRLLMPRAEYEDFKRLGQHVYVKAEKFGLVASRAAAVRLLEILDKADLADERYAIFDVIEKGRLQTACGSVFVSTRDELRERMAVLIDAADSKYYKSEGPLFGAQVANKFPGASEDVKEAGNCGALGQGTASVFHLMRAMELAVGQLAEALRIGNLDREWGKLLSDIHAKIESMPKGPTRDEWSECHANLYHVKQAWRNKTMQTCLIHV